jgi:UDP-N-acetylmuramate dehydrogenase
MLPFLHDIPLADKTTFKIGGNAAFYCTPHTADEIQESLLYAQSLNIPSLILGKGSNLLVSDRGWPGLVIDTSKGFNKITWDGFCATAESGALLHAMVKDSVDKGYFGLEKIAGVPGSIGGAVVMNAGAFGQCVSDCLVSVEYIDRRTNEIVTDPCSVIKPAYRNSIFSTANFIIVAATFCFKPDDAHTAIQSYRDVLAKRKDRHPLDLPNCGSVFKNPEGTTAGKLIESCGLKGTMVGGAQVSLKHANFIVNINKASARDVRALVVLIQKTVYEKTDVLLEPEVLFVG